MYTQRNYFACIKVQQPHSSINRDSENCKENVKEFARKYQWLNPIFNECTDSEHAI